MPADAGAFGTGAEFHVDRVVVDGAEIAVRGLEAPPVLSVSSEGLRLVTGCHDVIAGYSLDLEGDLTLSDPRGPRVGCADLDLQQADRLVEVVSNGSRWTMVDGDLIATKGDVEVTFARLDAR